MSSFVHLHGHTEYSLFDGIGRIKDLVAYVKELGQEAVAITDHGVMYGAIELYKEAKAQGIHPIIGCEMYVTERELDDQLGGKEQLHHLILLAETNEGYQNLAKLDSIANTIGMKGGKPRINRQTLQQYASGLIAMSACIRGEIPQLLLNGNVEGAKRTMEWYIETFGRDHFFVELQDHGLAEEREVRSQLIALAREYQVGLVATNDFHYLRQEDADVQNIRLCISTGQTVDNQKMKFPNDSFYVKSTEEMAALFADVPEALENTVKIARRCQVNFAFGEHHLPAYQVPQGKTAALYLRELCEQALPEKYEVVTQEVRDRLEYELGIIESMGFSDYFLITMDFIAYAKRRKIAVGPGRGSAAGSIVAYLLGITGLDPLQYGLLFERFLNPERISMPDIDTDLCYKGRGEVIEYLARTYGQSHVAQIITFGTMAARAVIRDVGRVMNLPYKTVDEIAKKIPAGPGVTLAKTLADIKEFREVYENDPQVKILVDYALELEGLSRNAGTHAAGIVISAEPVSDHVPLQYSADGYLQTQYEKDTVEELGLLKMDLLGLRNLTVIREALAMIQESRGITIDPDQLPTEDPVTCAMLCAGDTVGVFQSESSGFTALLRQLRPERFEDLIPMVALYRPGPLGSGMAEDFIKRRHGETEVDYPHPMLEPILEETFGVILYQEQVMQIASTMAGFSLGEADLLRRAMGKKKEDVLLAQRDAFLQGAAAKGVPESIANHVFDLMVYFAGYGFNKSHSVCYGYIAWQTAYLKAHYRPEFMAAMMSCYKESTDKLTRYIADCRLHGIRIKAPDINRSGTDFCVENGEIVFGLSAVKSVGEGLAEEIIRARNQLQDEQRAAGENPQGFRSMVELTQHVNMNKRALEALIQAGALDSLYEGEEKPNRAQLSAAVEEAVRVGTMARKSGSSLQGGLFDDMVLETPDVVFAPLEPWSAPEVLAHEKDVLGFYVSGHPLDAYEKVMEKLTPIYELLEGGEKYDGKKAWIGGTITHMRRLLTRKGDQMAFVTMEDFGGELECVVFPKVWEESSNLLAEDAAFVVEGRVQATEQQVKLIVNRLLPMELVASGEIVLPNAEAPVPEPIQPVGQVEVKEVPSTPDSAPAQWDGAWDEVEEVHLVIDAEHESQAVTKAFGELLNKHRGDVPVTLHIARTGQKIPLLRTNYLTFNERTASELQALFGTENVRWQQKREVHS